MMDENNACKDTISRIFKVQIEKEEQEKYLELIKSINEYLKEKHSNHFLCFILLQDKEDSSIIYNVELYNNIEDEEISYNKLLKEVQDIYDKQDDLHIKRTLIEDPKEINRIFPS